jgi:hypothetical protein
MNQFSTVRVVIWFILGGILLLCCNVLLSQSQHRPGRQIGVTVNKNRSQTGTDGEA